MICRERGQAGRPSGPIRIHELTSAFFSGGSWIIEAGHPHHIAVETVVLLYDLCFDQLGNRQVLPQVVKESRSVIELHQRFGAALDREDEGPVYLINTFESVQGPRRKFVALLGLT